MGIGNVGVYLLCVFIVDLEFEFIGVWVLLDVKVGKDVVEFVGLVDLMGVWVSIDLNVVFVIGLWCVVYNVMVDNWLFEVLEDYC